jgi:hypothetical protein
MHDEPFLLDERRVPVQPVEGVGLFEQGTAVLELQAGLLEQGYLLEFDVRRRAIL